MLRNKHEFTNTFSQLSTFKTPKTIRSRTNKNVITGKPIKTNGKTSGGPKHDL
ncbi:hypothetical protein [Flavobacterium sp. FlaQc-48]|uniref:hypothetical protein n=1 Tax=Flavobacterium sp. FlaQc-48 TaxID=3374181 RepID=UPI00375771A2